MPTDEQKAPDEQEPCAVFTPIPRCPQSASNRRDTQKYACRVGSVVVLGVKLLPVVLSASPVDAGSNPGHSIIHPVSLLVCRKAAADDPGPWAVMRET